MTEKEKEENKDLYSPRKLQDIISPVRIEIMEKWSDRSPQLMLKFLASQIGIIERHFPEIKEKINKRLDDPKTTLYTSESRLTSRNFFEWWQLLETPGAEADWHWYMKERGGMDQVNNQIQIYDYCTMFDLIPKLFNPGLDNICYGAKKDGKSSFLFNLMCDGTKQGFKFITNIRVKKEHQDDLVIKENIHIHSWMWDVLRTLSDNMIRNITLKEKGYPNKCTMIGCVLDEGETFMDSKRSGSKEALDFNMFNQLTRKLFCSVTWIFHRLKSVPPDFRNSPNLNAKILKGIDFEGNKLPSPKQQAIIEFVGTNEIIYLDGIPPNAYFDTNAPSSFDIFNPDNPEKSIRIKSVLQIIKDLDGIDIPKAIIRFLDEVKVENQPFENFLEMAKRVHEEVKYKIYNCTKQSEYYTIAKLHFQEKYKLADISINKNAEKGLKAVISDEWDLHQIEQRELKEKGYIESKPERINHLYADIEVIKLWLEKYNTKVIKAIVQFNYRKVNEDDIKLLIDYGISKNKITTLYGNPSKEIVFHYNAKQ